MGSVAASEDGGQVVERAFDVEETLFVAVGKNVEKHKTTLFWAVQNFAPKKICLLHVHQPLDSVASSPDRNVDFNETKQDAVETLQGQGRKEMDDAIVHYYHILAQEGVGADVAWIELDSIEKGIVNIIVRYNIRWLVMGAGEDKYYSKKFMGLKSKKATFVCKHAPVSCHIWFPCNGCLMYTREGRDDGSEAEVALLLLKLNLGFEGRNDGSEFVAEIHRSLDVEEDADDFDEALESLNCSMYSDQMMLRSLSMPLLADKDEKTQEQMAARTASAIKHAVVDAKSSKQKAFVEAIRQWKEENNAMEAKCKTEALLRKEMEEALARERQEVQRMKDQCDECMKELQLIKKQKSLLESQLVESDCTGKELEEKIFSAVDLLITFKERRDTARLDYENAKREVERLRRLVKMGAAGICRSEILEFSFMEINAATNNFDPSWRIGDGRHGSIYRGLLRHVHVAIKMLPSYGSQSQLEFQNGIEILSRVRHQNLLILVGTCPESRSLVYEYARNGSLEDRLRCKGKTPPLPWQTRIKIAVEICSALMFLHSNKPCICHGNLKPSKILLDANFVSKLGDFGLLQLIKQGQMVGDRAQISNGHDLDLSSAYTDPQYFETGMLTPESDVYSFGVILLQLLAARPVVGIIKDVKCAVENDNLKSVLDYSAGDWPLEQAKKLANLALRCCENSLLLRPDLVSDIWRVLEPMKTSGTNPISCLTSKEVRGAPSHFLCPIFQEVMQDPLIAADGFTYEADAIKGWLKSGHNTSPMTNLKLGHCNLVPNHALHQAIQEWKQQRW